MSAANNPAVLPKERNFVITCAFAAPRRLLFKAWTEPDRLKSWWGPNGFTTPVCKTDLRPGGVFHYCMRSPEGKDYWGKGIYREVVEPERIVYIDCFSDAEGNLVQPASYGMSQDWPAETMVVITFSEQNGKTEMTITSSVSESLAEQVGARQGWTESLVRLTEYLARETN